MAKFTKDDIKLLAKQMRASCKDEKPFTLLTGAGCSVSAGIPLAGTLVKEILKTYGDECRRQLDDEQLRDYGACMSCVPINARRKLFSEHLKKASINWAHISIACLMNAGYVGRVITFNFDSILARACSLLGMYPPTYDFAAAATVDTDYIAPQAIIHLHGQGTGKYLLNSDEETHNHAEHIRPLIRATFADSSLLALGYSGSSDAVFQVLTQEYGGRENLWWAGYETDPNKNIYSLIKPYDRVAYYLGECDADEFLIELARELQCFPPTLFSDPYGHLLSELGPVAEFPLTKSESSDILTSLKNELIESQKRFNTDQKIPELMMKGEWVKVIELSDPENSDHKDNLAWANFMLGNELAEKGILNNDEILIQQSFALYQQATTIKPDGYEAFINWGAALSELAKINGDSTLFQQAIEKYQQVISIKPDMYEALINWGAALFELAKINGDSTLFQQAIEKYQQIISIKPDMYEALINWGAALSELAKINGDSALFQKAIEKYKQATAIKPDGYAAFFGWANALSGLAKAKTDTTLFQQSFEKYHQTVIINPDDPRAFDNWGVTLTVLAKINGDATLFHQAIDKYQHAIAIKPNRYEAFYNWGNALSELAKIRGDEDLFQQSYEKYKQAININPNCHEAFFSWANGLSELAKIKADAILFQQSFEKYYQAISIKPNDNKTFNNWGLALSELAKIKRDSALYQQAIEKYQQAITIRPDDHMAFYNWGNALFALANINDDDTLFQKSLEKYSQAIDINPDGYIVLRRWGNALSSLGEIKKNIVFFEQSFEKYQLAIKITPDDHEVFNNWGVALMNAFKLTTQKEYMEKALEILGHGEKLKPDQVFNLACLYSLLKEKDKCKEKLLHCHNSKTLPDKAHLLNDKDLDNVRSESWFEELINSID